MKKHIKLTAVLSTAAVMTAFAPVFSVPALAKPIGWVQENGSWKFYDSDGYALTDSWKKQDGSWFYLDEDGDLSFNRQVDEYYVGDDGKRVADKWVSIANDDIWDSSDAPEFYWYYYGNDGKATVSKFKTIEGQTYYFDDEGRMVTGLEEINGATYYFGDVKDGVMKKGWVELPENMDEPDDETVWHYFDNNGKRIENQIDKKISGHYYTFQNGKMVTGWFKLPQEAAKDNEASESAKSSESTESVENTEATENTSVSETVESAETSSTVQESAASEKAPLTSAAGYQYYMSDGKRASGWMTIEGIPGLSEEDETYNFYFKNGQPCYAQTGIQVFSVNSGKYGFNTKGEMQTGLQVVTLADGSVANYYFGTDGAMKVGRQIILDEESDLNQTWFFHTEGAKRGQGFHGIRDNVIYVNGLRQEADLELRYSPVTFEGKNYLVNPSGTIQKASSSSKSSSRPELGKGFKDIKDTNDTIWTVDVNGIIQ